jgi:hypothetical protein
MGMHSDSCILHLLGVGGAARRASQGKRRKGKEYVLGFRYRIRTRVLQSLPTQVWLFTRPLHNGETAFIPVASPFILSL